MTTAKVFMNGRSQAIRLPKEFRVRGPEVAIQRVAQGILITERDPWEVCLEACQELSDDFMQERVQPPTQRRDWSKGR
jgi:antitoxin VapB